jgi:Ca2+ transporting ATPase
MDTLASLALATEDPHEHLLLRKPHSRSDYIISKTMMKHIIGQSIFQIILMLILIFAGETFIPE